MNRRPEAYEAPVLPLNYPAATLPVCASPREKSTRYQISGVLVEDGSRRHGGVALGQFPPQIADGALVVAAGGREVAHPIAEGVHLGQDAGQVVVGQEVLAGGHYFAWCWAAGGGCAAWCDIAVWYMTSVSVTRLKMAVAICP